MDLRSSWTSIGNLGYINSNEGVTADPECAVAIWNYLTPRNQKQLRQVLGTCNFHQRFIVRYAEYMAPLVVLLKKGMKWRCQEAFEKLKEAFATSVCLAHPRRGLPYVIYTDACSYTISGVLMQVDCGRTSIISTM
jgi:hypothetical protein